MRDQAFDAGPIAQIVVDREGVLVQLNDQARTAFGLSLADVGRPLKDLEVSYRPVDLRSNLELAFAERRTILLPGIGATMPYGDQRDLDVHIVPLLTGDEPLGATVLFHDVSLQHRLEEDLDASRREIQTAYEELQSTVEELETTNEELQSSNEELETTNEELQSSNEELETINDELSGPSEELDQVNAFLETILTSIGLAVVVVDAEQRVKVWNGHSTDLWGVRAYEAEGEPLLSLDIGLPLDELRTAMQSEVSRGQARAEAVVDATNRRGRTVRCKLTCLPLALDGAERITGAVVLMDVVDEVASETR